MFTYAVFSSVVVCEFTLDRVGFAPVVIDICLVILAV